MNEPSPQRIGLFGFGTVGQGLYEVLQHTPTLRVQIDRICIKDPNKQRALATEIFTLDRDAILHDPRIQVVVELIDDPEAAFDIVSRALLNGKAVVSANKRLIATRLRELLHLQEQTGMPFLYEASTCGSIPIIRNLEEYYDSNVLERVAAIVNGTTNYILTALDSSTTTGFAEALAEAQRLGFAESDPTLDVEGYDAAYKTAIIAAHAFGVIVDPERVIRRGITAITPFDISVARQRSCAIKFLSQVRQKGDRLSAVAMPCFMPIDSPLASIGNEVNAVELTAPFTDAQLLVGKGAGRRPTASAVLSDIAALRYSYRYEYKKLQQQLRPTLQHGGDVCVYVRGSLDAISTVPFRTIEQEHRSSTGNYIVGQVQLSALQTSSAFRNDDTFIALVDGAR